MNISKEERERRIKEELEAEEEIGYEYIERAKKIKENVEKCMSTEDVAKFIEEWEETTKKFKRKRVVKMGAVYLKVTRDRYELPIMQAKTVRELANKAGVSRRTIYSALNKAQKNGNKCQYIKIIDDEEEKELERRAKELKEMKSSIWKESKLQDVVKFIVEWEKTTKEIKQRIS